MPDKGGDNDAIKALRRELKTAHEELNRTNSELLQLTLELDDRVEERTRALQESEAELRRHRDQLELLVEERTAQLKQANADLSRHVAELRASEERFAGLVRTIPDIVYRIAPDGEFLFINEAVTRLGYAPDELVGRHFSEFIVPIEQERLSREELLPLYSGQSVADHEAPKLVDERRTGPRKTTGLVVGLLRKGEPEPEPAELETVGADLVVAEINSAGLYEINEEAEARVFIGTVGVIRDITARRIMEQQLQEARVNLEQKVVERTRELQEAIDALEVEVEERKKVEERLRFSEERFRTLVDVMGEGIVVQESSGKIVHWNRAAGKVFGLKAEQAVGINSLSRDWHTIQEDGSVFLNEDHPSLHTLRTGEPCDGVVMGVRHSEQETVWIKINTRPLRKVGSKAHDVVISFSDITENKRHEKDLLESEQLLRSILDGMGAAVFYVDPAKYEIVEANTVGAELLGLPREQLIGARCCDLICPGQHAVPGQNCRLYMKKVLDQEKQLELPSGRIIPVIKHVLPVDIRGRKHHVEIIFDLSERKVLERQLAYAQKLESIGQLAAGIAHEINTPIQYIGGNIYFFETAMGQIRQVCEAYGTLLRAVLSGEDAGVAAGNVQELLDSINLDAMLEEIPEALADSREGVERVATIVQAMKNFSHPDVEAKKPLDVNAAIENTLTIARNEWKYNSEVETDLSPDLPPLHCVPGDFNQAMLNIIVNAAHANAAMHKDDAGMGAIRIRTRLGQDSVVITVEDTGTGIDPAHWDRIFDPFFTTKEVGKGTGQGLAITHSIMEKHEGSITFTTEPGKGTTFVIVFPVGEAGPNDAVTETKSGKEA